MAIREEQLCGCREFAAVEPAARRLLAERMVERPFAKGELLLCEGAPADGLLLLAQGEATVTVRGADGSERVLGFVRAGDVVGEMALLTQAPRSASVWADSDGRALALAARDFHQLAGREPSVAVILTNLVAERLGTKAVDALRNKQLDRFRIVRCIGRGSMAVVYAAVDTRDGALVALKMMSHRLVYAEGARLRFEREAAILTALDHPNIARIRKSFAAFRTRFIAMEYCDGPALATVLAECGPLDEPVARAVLGQLAAALAHLHARGVVHRDLKPGNVMLLRDGTLKLADFGLAKPLPRAEERRGAAAVDDPDASGIVGTPLYMAPEQFSSGAASTLADLYAFGCIAWELLTGAPAFPPTDLRDLIDTKLAWRLPPREEIGAGVSEELARLLKALLSPYPANRAVDLAAIARWAAPVPRPLLERALRPPRHERIVRH